MNDQTSPTAGGQGQGSGSTPWQNPFHEPRGAQGLPGVPRFGDGRPPETGTRSGMGSTLLLRWRADVLAFAILLAVGTALGALSGLAWYRFAPTVWLTIPADAVSQVKANVDQSVLLVAPEAKGIASVDGYYFMITAAAGLLLGVLGFWLGKRGPLGGRERSGQYQGAGVGAWAGVLAGGAAAATLAAALGRWLSLPDPLTLLHTIAAGHNFHATVALHAQGLYLAAPVLGTVLFLALTAAFTKPAPPEAPDYGQRSPMFFSSDNPYGFSEDGQRGKQGTAAPGSSGGAPTAGATPPNDGGESPAGTSPQEAEPGPEQPAEQQADPFRS
ncbi:MAG: hypothetical protein HOV87_32930 [Catenulispora sp.]|nr:hypothetical protein [Catenulispora sp.]